MKNGRDYHNEDDTQNNKVNDDAGDHDIDDCDSDGEDEEGNNNHIDLPMDNPEAWEGTVEALMLDMGVTTTTTEAVTLLSSVIQSE